MNNIEFYLSLNGTIFFNMKKRETNIMFSTILSKWSVVQLKNNDYFHYFFTNNELIIFLQKENII